MKPAEQELADLMAHARLGYNPPGSPSRAGHQAEPVLSMSLGHSDAEPTRRQLWVHEHIRRPLRNLRMNLRRVAKRSRPVPPGH
ncbi:hypothetical protein ABZ721_33035 [Streptomyces sp. NPDC006733]|uniref:hypothetical protein n=1 Tax=Streptomyces sp. NPDC006733 TaxID=3155460 RepID=UPI0033F8A939